VADPQASPEKLDRLIELHERARARGAQSAFARALAALQPDLPVIAERGEIADDDGRVQWRYALWEDINESVRPLLAKHGFSLSFRTCSEAARVTVTGILLHKGGHAEETSLSLPLDLSGCKNAVQAVGSSTSYGKRYVAQALLNVTSRGADDDAQAAATFSAIDPAQVDALRQRVAAVGADESRLAAYLGVASLADLPAEKLGLAQDVLAGFGRRRPE
jgi:hypothetical protein